MEYIVNQQQMQALDAHSIERMGISGLFLMEQAARAVFQEMKAFIKKENQILIVVESGNNGGDGLALARMLKEAEYNVLVFFVHGTKTMSDSFLEQMHLAEEKEVPIIEELPAEQAFDVIVDGMFGVGLTRQIKGIHKRVIEWMNRQDSYFIAIDMPSGIHATTGAVMGTALKADMTVTFGYLKAGLIKFPGSEYAGKIKVCDIGFAVESLWHVKPTLMTFGEGKQAVIDALSYFPSRYAWAHKGSYGNVLLVAGSEGMAGAAVLAAKSAYRSGCGMVRVITHESNREILGTLVPEAIVMSYETLQEAYDLLDASWQWADAVLIGSGLSQSELAVGLTGAVVTYASEQRGSMKVVVDGDAITILAGHREIMKRYQELPVTSRPHLTFTPHSMELARLCGAAVSDVEGRELEYASRYIKQHWLKDWVTIVAKGPRTVVTSGYGATYINMTGNDGMATAGSGDCLAGMLTSVYAQVVRQEHQLTDKLLLESKRAGLAATMKQPFFMAACVAVCLHGYAGDVAKRERGRISMTAMDLVDSLPEVMKWYDK